MRVVVLPRHCLRPGGPVPSAGSPRVSDADHGKRITRGRHTQGVSLSPRSRNDRAAAYFVALGTHTVDPHFTRSRQSVFVAVYCSFATCRGTGFCSGCHNSDGDTRNQDALDRIACDGVLPYGGQTQRLQWITCWSLTRFVSR